MEIGIQIFGWIGTILFLLAYVLVTYQKIDATGRVYQLLNLIGAVFMGINVFYEHVWAAFALEIVWGSIAILALSKIK